MPLVMPGSTINDCLRVNLKPLAFLAASAAVARRATETAAARRAALAPNVASDASG